MHKIKVEIFYVNGSIAVIYADAIHTDENGKSIVTFFSTHRTEDKYESIKEVFVNDELFWKNQEIKYE